jgi:hypothetical protein
VGAGFMLKQGDDIMIPIQSHRIMIAPVALVQATEQVSLSNNEH